MLMFIRRIVCLLLCSFLLVQSLQAQTKPFRFAFISDTHIGSPNGGAEEDLRRTVADINNMTDIDFVVITGDITELGMDSELQLAKRILDSLHVKYFIIPGNHDSGWSESGGVSFTKVFGSDRFLFDHNGIRMFGCPSGPYVRMSDGHVPRDAVNWIGSIIDSTDDTMPIIFFNHYPLDNGLDNWYEVADRLKTRNTIAYLCGHGHANKAYDFEGIPGVMGRSNLRAKDAVGGYNLVDVSADSIVFRQRKPGTITMAPWTRVIRNKHTYIADGKTYARPSYAINEQYANVRQQWSFASDANVVNTPAANERTVVFGNSNGLIQALSKKDGKPLWSYRTGAAIYSSVAIANDRMVVGSADGNVYCLQLNNGKMSWQFKADAAVLGSPLIVDDKVFIGSSDHHFRCLDLRTGKMVWSFAGLDGPVMGLPVVSGDKVIFGAWDRNLYALDKATGKLLWSWNNGSPIRNFSPAACTPVVKDDVVYVVAPDRYTTAIDINTGTALWRTNELKGRESIGMSADGKWIMAKTMNDSIFALAPGREKQPVAWVVDCKYGYDHVPSQLIEKDGQVFFGTRSGVVYAVDIEQRKVAWAHKIDNSMVNTVRVLDKRHIIASTMDGKVVMLQVD